MKAINRKRYSRPYWPARNPGDKRWYCLALARDYRDRRAARIRRILLRWGDRLWGRPNEHRLQRELRRLCRLAESGLVDEWCFSAHAARRWRVEGREIRER